jgi:hypothetical protein
VCVCVGGGGVATRECTGVKRSRRKRHARATACGTLTSGGWEGGAVRGRVWRWGRGGPCAQHNSWVGVAMLMVRCKATHLTRGLEKLGAQLLAKK